MATTIQAIKVSFIKWAKNNKKKISSFFIEFASANSIDHIRYFRARFLVCLCYNSEGITSLL